MEFRDTLMPFRSEIELAQTDVAKDLYISAANPLPLSMQTAANHIRSRETTSEKTLLYRSRFVIMGPALSYIFADNVSKRTSTG